MNISQKLLKWQLMIYFPPICSRDKSSTIVVACTRANFLSRNLVAEESRKSTTLKIGLKDLGKNKSLEAEDCKMFLHQEKLMIIKNNSSQCLDL
jgi:hypothetical protein